MRREVFLRMQRLASAPLCERGRASESSRPRLLCISAFLFLWENVLGVCFPKGWRQYEDLSGGWYLRAVSQPLRRAAAQGAGWARGRRNAGPLTQPADAGD